MKFKLFGVLHVADIFWLILAGLLVYGAVVFSAPLTIGARSGDVTIRFTIEFGSIYHLPAGFHEQFTPGGRLVDGARGLDLGEIVAIYAHPLTEDVFDEAAGVVRHAPVSGMELMYVTMETRARMTDYETTVNGHPLAVGREIFARSKYFAGQSFVVAIEVVGEER
jgi:hypothetical protein